MDRNNYALLVFIIVFIHVIVFSSISIHCYGEKPLFLGKVTIIPTVYEGSVSIATPDRIYNVVSIGNASIDPCLWGLEKYSSKYELSGESIMKIENHILYVRTQLDLGSLKLPWWQVIGYNEIIYGIKPWGMPSYHHVPLYPFKLPSKINLLPRIILLANYSLLKFNTRINFAYDLWFKKENKTNGVWPGDAELMIWLYRDNVDPAGKKIYEISSKAIINGSITNVKWSVWLYEKMGTGWLYIALVISNPIRRGLVGIDLTDLIEKTKPFFEKYLQTSLEEMYLMSIELGSEIFYSKYINVEWSLSKYIITIYSRNTSTINALIDTIHRFLTNKDILQEKTTTSEKTSSLTTTTTPIANTRFIKTNTKANINTNNLGLNLIISFILVIVIGFIILYTLIRWKNNNS